MDNAAEQIKKIRALHLPVDELDACNRMAFYLGWAIKRGQMSNPFLSRYREIVDAVQAGKGPDLRVFILDKLDGKLSTQFFDRRGSGFAQWYAQDNRSNPYIYRRDCRNIVLARLKDRVWNSIAEKEAATYFYHIPKKSVRVWSSCWMSGINSIWKRNLQMTPRSAWRGQRKGNRLSFPTGTASVLLRFDRVAQDGCKVQIMDRLFPEREIWVGRAVGPSTPGIEAMCTAKVMNTTSRTAASMISGTSAASTRTLSDF